MWSASDLPEITDASTIGRGRAYVRTARVTALERRGNHVRAEVQGGRAYRVELGERTWSCDCPVGVAGGFCKHCVAAVIALSEADEDPTLLAIPSDAANHDDPVGAWLDGLPREDLRHLLQVAAERVAGVSDVLAHEYLAVCDDLGQLREEVDGALRPTRSFYDYRAANRYAGEAQGLLDVLHARRERPSAELLSIVERAITLTVRTILRSDDSSGAQGDQVRGLLSLHADVARGLAGTLDAKARRRLANWLHDFRFSGRQDFFEIDVDGYAEVLETDGIARYRTLVEASADSGTETWAVQYALGRLAILDRDASEIVRVFGREMATSSDALRVVRALDEAGLPRLAVEHARRGLSLARSPHRHELVDRLVADAVERGDLADALDLRRDDHGLDPSARSLAALRSAAEGVGTWEGEKADAEARLASRRPHEWLAVLVESGRDAEAWQFATSQPDAATAAGIWETLCARRLSVAPEETLPVYRHLVERALQVTGRSSYVTAARLLTRLREASERAGRTAEFGDYLGHVIEGNRRRPTCLAEFRRAGLMS